MPSFNHKNYEQLRIRGEARCSFSSPTMACNARLPVTHPYANKFRGHACALKLVAMFRFVATVARCEGFRGRLSSTGSFHLPLLRRGAIRWWSLSLKSMHVGNFLNPFRVERIEMLNGQGMTPDGLVERRTRRVLL